MFAYRLSVIGSVAPPGTAWDAGAYAGTWPMRTRQWYSSLVGGASGKVNRFLHNRTLPEVQEPLSASALSRSAGDFARPLLCLPVQTSADFGIEMQALGDGLDGFPLSALVRQQKLVNGAQGAGLTQQNSFGFRIQRNLCENFRHRHAEHDVQHGKQSQQEKIRFAVRRVGAQQLAEAAANHGAEHEVAGFVLTGANNGHQPHPAAHLPVSKNRQGVADGM